MRILVRSRQRFIRSCLLGSAFLFVCSAGVFGAGKTWITIQNASFEDPVLATGTFTVNTPAGWQETAPNGANSFTENLSGFAYLGKNHEGIMGGDAIWQDLSVGIEPNTIYVLVVAVGNRNATYTTPGNQSMFKLQLNNGGSVTDLAALTVNASTVPAGTFKNFRLVYESSASPPAGTLRIRLQVNSADRAHFDGVQLLKCTPFSKPPEYYPPHPQTPPWPQETVPILNSRLGAPAVIHLDFDGETFGVIPEWNWGAPFSVAHSGLSAVEIRRAFETVKEDFLPFNVNVTTDPALYWAAPSGARMRCVFTPTDDWVFTTDRPWAAGTAVNGESPSRPYLEAGGGAQSLQSFRRAGTDFDPQVPLFIFINAFRPYGSANPTGIESSGLFLGSYASHELGHTMGLVHDGTTSDPTGYWVGHGVLSPVWGPIDQGDSRQGRSLYSSIMGTPDGKLSQWSRGEYVNASNDVTVPLQDDVSIIGATGPGTNNFGFVPDGIGNTIGTAAPLGISGGSFEVSGMIGRNSAGGADTDFYSFTLPAQAQVTILAKPAEPFSDPDPEIQQRYNAGIANLKMQCVLYNSNQTVNSVFGDGADTPVIPDNPTPVQKLNPTEYLRCRITRTLAPGTYWFEVASPVAFGDPSTNGFSNYGNMGAYTVIGAVSYTVPQITSSLVASGVVSQPFNTYQATATPGPVTWSAVGLPGGLGINSGSGEISGVPNEQGTFNVILRATNAAAVYGEATLVITITTPAPPTIISANSLTCEEGQPLSPAYQIVATGGATSYGVVGGAVPGLSVNSTTGVITGAATTPGVTSMTLSASNSWGTGTLVLTVTVRPSPPTALDNTLIGFTRPDAVKWFGQTAVASDGTDAMQSPALNHNEQSSIETNVTGPGTIEYFWRADTEPGDVLSLKIDSTTYDFVSGSTGWISRSVAVPAGAHTLRWTFARNASGSGGSDTVWLDRVVWTATAGPTITSPLTVNWTCGQQSMVYLTSNDPSTVWTMGGSLPAGAFFIGNPTNIIGAAIQRPGVYVVTLYATNSQGATTRAFTINAESSYAAWARGNGLSPGSELADDDKDGVPNIAELAFALDPFVANPGFQPVSFDVLTGRLRATFKRQHQFYPDLRYEVEASGNLVNWTAIARSDNGNPLQNLGGAQSVSETQVGSSSVYNVTVIDGTAQSTGTPKRFLRLKISQQ